jgi:hypothetical protein
MNETSKKLALEFIGAVFADIERQGRTVKAVEFDTPNQNSRYYCYNVSVRLREVDNG